MRQGQRAHTPLSFLAGRPPTVPPPPHFPFGSHPATLHLDVDERFCGLGFNMLKVQPLRMQTMLRLLKECCHAEASGLSWLRPQPNPGALHEKNHLYFAAFNSTAVTCGLLWHWGVQKLYRRFRQLIHGSTLWEYNPSSRLQRQHWEHVEPKQQHLRQHNPDVWHCR